MRLAVIPAMNLGVSSLLGDSSLHGWWNWSKRITELCDDVFVYLLLPEGLADWEFKHERVEALFQDESVGYYVMHGEMPYSFMRLFSPIIGKYPVDAVVTERVSAIGWISRALMEPRFKSQEVPIVTDEAMVLDWTSKMQMVPEAEMVAKMLGYVISTPVFHSDWERDIALRVMRRYLSSHVIDDVRDRARVCGRFLDVESLEKHIVGVEKNKEFTLFVGQRLNNTKHGKELLEVYDKFYSAGRSVRIVATSPRCEAFSLETWLLKDKIFPEIEFLPNCSRDRFWKEAASAHVCLNLSSGVDEGFSLGYLEQILCGPVPLIPNVDWVNALMGPVLKEYPYKFESPSEAAGMLRYVYENYEEAQGHAQKLREYIRGLFAGSKGEDYDLKLLDIVREIVGQTKHLKMTKGSIELLKTSMIGLDDEFTLDKVWKTMLKNSRFMTSELRVRGGQPSKAQVYWWLCENGYKDSCKSAIATFMKKKEEKDES